MSEPRIRRKILSAEQREWAWAIMKDQLEADGIARRPPETSAGLRRLLAENGIDVSPLQANGFRTMVLVELVNQNAVGYSPQQWPEIAKMRPGRPSGVPNKKPPGDPLTAPPAVAVVQHKMSQPTARPRKSKAAAGGGNCKLTLTGLTPDQVFAITEVLRQLGRS